MERSFTPQYYRIEQSLRARIAGLAVGDPLPSDSALSREFDVSRMTVRQAFQALVQEGLVERRPGSGTFVADTASHRQATVLIGFSDEARRKGKVPTSRILEATVRAAVDSEAVVLGIADGDEIVVLRRLRIADAVPVALENAVLRGSAKGVLESDLADGSLHAALRSEGINPVRGRATVLAARADADEAALLDLDVGDALLVERRLIFDDAGDPVEFTESRYAAERYELDVEFVVASS